MIEITLPDGSTKEFEKGATPMDVANSISQGLARNVISAKFEDTIVETTTPLTENGALVLFTSVLKGQLFYVKKTGELVYSEKVDGKKYLASSFMTGKEVGEFKKRKLKKEKKKK